MKNTSSFNADYSRWKSWDANNFGKISNNQLAYFQSEIRRIPKSFSQTLKVLEIGFGDGSFLKYSQLNGWDIFGTEANETLVNLAHSKGFKAVNSDNLIIYDSDSFDLIVAFDVLEHIAKNKILDFLQEVDRVLRGGGFFIARFPNGDSPFGLPHQNGDFTHVSSIGSGMVTYMASQVNFQIIFIGGQSEPIIGCNLLLAIHRIFTLPLKWFINKLINLVFFPRKKIAFLSPNMTIIFKSRKIC